MSKLRSRRVVTATMGLLLAGLSVGAAPTAAAAQSDSQTAALQVLRLRNLKSGLCMGVEGGSTSNGSRVLQWTCDGSRNQKWAVNRDGGYHEIYNDNSRSCLGVSGGSSAQGTQLVIWECDGKDNQQWRTENSTECGVILVNKFNQLASVDGGSTANGAPVIQWPHASSRDQTWCVEVVAG